MRRALMVVLGISMLVLLAATPVSAGVDDGRAEVIHGSWPCAVGWSDANWGLEGDCDVHNVLTASGEYHLVLHGQIPEDAMGEFVAAGSPKQFHTICLVNWRFWAESGSMSTMLFTESVRKFTPNGQMTEVCKPPVVFTIP